MDRKKLREIYLLKDKNNKKPLWEFGPQVEDAVDRYFKRRYDDSDAFE